MAGSAAIAPSTGFGPLQIAVVRQRIAAATALETWLEAEREQLFLWLPVTFGVGVVAWDALPDPARWSAFMLAAIAISLLGWMTGPGGRIGRMMLVGGMATALGCGAIWWRAERVAAPVLAGAVTTRFDGRVVAVEPLPARGLVRWLLATDAGAGLPRRVRVNVPDTVVASGGGAHVAAGDRVRVRARLMPPAAPAVPGAYDFQRAAWFAGVGATGRAFDVEPLSRQAGEGASLRQRLARHIVASVEGRGGAIAATLATGDRGAIAEEDGEAMRRAGLAHLLSISGLHVAAVSAAAMFVGLRILALSPVLALRWRLPVVAALAGAVAAVGYTWLTGAAVPTIRSCVAALLILAGMAMGREAVTLRLVAMGALVVLLAWPETLAGPSFQLSFAAVVAIVALHEHPRARALFARREEGHARRLVRAIASLLLTGLAVEAALMPIAIYHFHKAGLYGAAANIVAIPLTTFVIMPAEGLALLLDLLGLGAPGWWVVGHALSLLLWIAHKTADAPGSVATLAAMPGGAFAAMILGGAVGRDLADTGSLAGGRSDDDGRGLGDREPLSGSDRDG